MRSELQKQRLGRVFLIPHAARSYIFFINSMRFCPLCFLPEYLALELHIDSPTFVSQKGSRPMRVPTLIQRCNGACVSAVHGRFPTPTNAVRDKVIILKQIWLKKNHFLLTDDVDLLKF